MACLYRTLATKVFEALDEHLQIISAAKYDSVGNVSMHIPLQLQAVKGFEGVAHVADFCGSQRMLVIHLSG